MLKVSPDKIHIVETATDKVPNTSATAASAGSDLNGMAVMVMMANSILLHASRRGLSGRINLTECVHGDHETIATNNGQRSRWHLGRLDKDGVLTEDKFVRNRFLSNAQHRVFFRNKHRKSV